jgi:hypothetical protein
LVFFSFRATEHGSQITLFLGSWRLSELEPDDTLGRMNSARFMLFAVVAFCLVPFAQLSAQMPQKSHEDCLKLVPGDWGANFGEKWKQHEAVYWDADSVFQLKPSMSGNILLRV